LYESAVDLMVKTPGFVASIIEQRLEGYFDAAYRFAEAHFGGNNLYMEALLANRRRLEVALSSRSHSAHFDLAV
jgi:acetyl/propionyl-CoA carboxylase alpha subunit